MYDSFDMACHDEDTDLRLNIKVNSENLLPTPQKYNLGSLRLPADPSWPKIPQRRLADDAGDLIQPPCIVTLMGTPRRSRTIVRSPQSQSCKLGGANDLGNFTSQHYFQKAQHPHSQLPKRRSGCTDPRFKKVTSVRSQMTSTDPGELEIDKQIEINCSTSKECKTAEDNTVLWKDTTRAQVIQQEAERPDEARGTESIGIQTVQTEITADMNQPQTKTFTKSNQQNLAEFRRKSCSPVNSVQKQLEPESPISHLTVLNRTPRNLEQHVVFNNNHSNGGTDLMNASNCSIDAIPQGKKGQSFSMAEKKLQSANNVPAENPPDSITEVKKQCYNVQVPVLSYQNVPVEISAKAQSRVDIPPQLLDSLIPDFQSLPLFNNIEIPKLELPNDAAPQFSNFGNTQQEPCFNQQLGNLGFQLKSDPTGQTVKIGSQKELIDFKVQEQTQFQNDKKYQSLETFNNDIISVQKETKFKYAPNASNISSKSQMNEDHRLKFKSSPKKLMKNIHNEEKCRPQQTVPNIFQDSFPKHNFHIYCHQDKPQKLCDVQSQQCRGVSNDSKSERHGNLINKNRGSNDQQERFTKNKNCIYVQQQTIDSESGQAAILDNKQGKYSHAPERLNTNFFDGHDNKNFQPSDHKDGGYLQQNKSRDCSPDFIHKTLPIHEQGRAPCLRQKRKMKSEEYLMLNKKRVQCSEPLITNCRRGSRTSHLKKANSYISKYTQQLTPDSESTYLYKHLRRPVYSCRKNEDKNASEGKDLSPHFQQCMNFIDFNKNNTEGMLHPIDLNDVKREHCTKPYQRPFHKSANTCSSLDLERRKFFPNKSPRAETDITFEQPTAIPVKTQQLLNKSYWDYYNKLKLHRMENGESPQQQYFCQVAMGAPQSKKRRTPELIVEESNNTSQAGDQVELSLPEIRTLEQCSVLSTMINNTLDSALQPSSETIRTKQIYLNGNMRSSSDPTAGTQSAILKKLFPGDNEDSIVSSSLMYKQKHMRDKHFNNKTSKLKSIGEHPVVFFGCMVYALIVFLPMIYDYFSYEEHDDYEDLSYVEIAFDYVIQSCKGAFGEFFSMMNKIFFKPDARMQQLSSGRWRQKMSNHGLI